MQEVATVKPDGWPPLEGFHSSKCKIVDPGEILRGKAEGVTTELLSTRTVFAIAIALTRKSAQAIFFTIPS
jgi:hypothetical protein